VYDLCILCEVHEEISSEESRGYFLKLRKGRVVPIKPLGAGNLFDARLKGVTKVDSVHLGSLFFAVHLGGLFWTWLEGGAEIEHGCPVRLASCLFGTRLGGVA